MAGKRNHKIKQGSLFVQVFALRAGSETGPLMDLTGYTARMHIRTEVTDAAVQLACTTDNGRITLQPTLGQITLTISATDTATLQFDAGVYDLELVPPKTFRSNPSKSPTR